MARIKMGAMVTAIRGSIGGFTYGGSISGPVTRAKSKPVRRLRSIQPQIRSTLGYLSRAWGDLTEAQRASWRTWALNHPETDSFGDEFIPSGINCFVKLNMVAMRLGGAGAEMSTPPADPPPASLATLTAIAGIGVSGDIDITVTINGTGAAADFIEFAVAGPLQSPGKVEVFSQKRYMQDIAGNLLVDTISGLDVGMYYWVYARYVDQYGQTTAWLTDQATPKV